MTKNHVTQNISEILALGNPLLAGLYKINFINDLPLI